METMEYFNKSIFNLNSFSLTIKQKIVVTEI